MIVAIANDTNDSGVAYKLAQIVHADGSSTHATPERLAHAGVSVRDIADALHQLCTLHGRHPGVVDLASSATNNPAAEDWLAHAGAAFVEERAYLIRVAAAAGPPPGTPGQAATEAALATQRNAIDLLSRSVRPGCALGAAIAVTLDWPVIRRPIDAAAERMGIDVIPCTLPSPAQTRQVIEAVAMNAAVERAMTFGIQQLLAQHRGLWDLIAARAESRG
ncbi:DUF6975 family protein [Sphingomonas sp. Leaf67]|uniref:DUF6975 family protein n=1 Tax=Sphingomonas sp. Leaf67 TaxID=1736230 RepID=UPI000A3F728A|nr:hypothetical protein [Sphingomonas sp. Leaf67]